MDVPWLDIPFLLLTLLLATRLAYDFYGAIAATFAGSLSLQIILFYCFARWYRLPVDGRGSGQSQQQASESPHDANEPPVLAPLILPDVRASMSNRCFAVVFLVFIPLIIVVFEQSQADILAYVLCFMNMIVMVIWLSPDSPSTATSVRKWVLPLSDDEDSSKGGGSTDDKCCVCLGGMREGQALRELPRCRHRFHDGCIGMWLNSHPTCPMCRSALAPAADDGGEPSDEALRLV